MQTLPTGTVSFLFTDIEGSTETLQAPQGELEIALRQPVQVQVRDQRVDLRRAAGKQREDPACKPLFHPPDPRAAHRHRPTPQRQLPGLAIPVPIPRHSVHGLPALRPAPPQELGDLFLQDRLEKPLNILPHPLLQVLPGDP